jgi:hypothetical protein
MNREPLAHLVLESVIEAALLIARSDEVQTRVVTSATRSTTC